METLKLLIDKLSQYNFLTNILPGTVLCIVLKYLVGYEIFISEDWYLMGIVFYFVGMVNNRLSSLVVEPILKCTHFVNFAPYNDFVNAEKKDAKVSTLSMENNVFRSYVSVFVLSLLAYGYKYGFNAVCPCQMSQELLLIILLLVLFAFSYRKQTKYVKKRVEANTPIENANATVQKSE